MEMHFITLRYLSLLMKFIFIPKTIYIHFLIRKNIYNFYTY